jgi:hypothetical protein
VEVIDGDRVGLLGEAARGPGDPGVLAERARVLADDDVVERRVAGQVVGVDDQVARGGRVSPTPGGDPQGHRAHADALAEVRQGGGLDGGNGYGMLGALAIGDGAAELLEPVPFNWLEETSKALPDTEMDAASTPSVVNATRTAAAAMAGTNKTANRRQRTRPCGAGSAGSADVLVEGDMAAPGPGVRGARQPAGLRAGTVVGSRLRRAR